MKNISTVSLPLLITDEAFLPFEPVSEINYPKGINDVIVSIQFYKGIGRNGFGGPLAVAVATSVRVSLFC